jgi:competence protein ComEC
MTSTRKYSLYLLATLAFIAFSLSAYVIPARGSDKLKISFLDIGQGDAIYIQAPNGRQMIVDGGPRGSLMRALTPEMSYGDKSIDVIINTNPDADHFAGFLDLLKTYSVGTEIESGVPSTTKTYAEFESLIKEKKIPQLVARKGMHVILDQARNISYDVLFPDRDVTGWTHNDASVVGRLQYGDMTVMLTGDGTIKTESLIIADNPAADIASTILKVGHHGSRTSTSDAFLNIVKPIYAVISAGLNNRYGHPHKEVTDRLVAHSIQTFVTKDVGTITFETDGKTLERVQ